METYSIPKWMWEPFCDDSGKPLICTICKDQIPRIDNGWHSDVEGVQHTDCSYQFQIRTLRTALEYYASHADGGTGVAERALDPFTK